MQLVNFIDGKYVSLQECYNFIDIFVNNMHYTLNDLFNLALYDLYILLKIREEAIKKENEKYEEMKSQYNKLYTPPSMPDFRMPEIKMPEISIPKI